MNKTSLLKDYGLYVGLSLLDGNNGDELKPINYIEESLEHCDSDLVSKERVEEFLKNFYKEEEVNELMNQFEWEEDEEQVEMTATNSGGGTK